MLIIQREISDPFLYRCHKKRILYNKWKGAGYNVCLFHLFPREQPRNVSDLRRDVFVDHQHNLDKGAVAIDGLEDPFAASSSSSLLHLPPSINDRFAFMIHEANVTRNGSARLQLSAARAANTAA